MSGIVETALSKNSPLVEPRWAVVTGGAARGGLAICRALHARGLGVVVHHSSAATAARTQAVVDAFNAERPQSALRWQAALEEAPAFPHRELAVAVVVCNASRWMTSECGDLHAARMDFDVHVTGHAAVLASLEDSLRRQHGAVVAVTDMHTQQPCKDHVWYLVAKAGLEMLVRALAVQWAPQVRCNAVAPGTLEWPEGWTDEVRRRAVLQSIPMAREGRFDELGQAVAWLALDATYVNGQTVRLDGGRSAWLK